MKRRHMTVMMACAAIASSAFGQAKTEAEAEAAHQVLHFWSNECASCHGQKGEGFDEVWSPSLAGLPVEYVIRQMDRFRQGLRGVQGPDENSRLMHREVIELDDDVLFMGLARLIASMPLPAPRPTVRGRAENGQVLYNNLCAQCHGAEAQGVADKHGPPLRGFQDWYVVRQLSKFQSSQRAPEAADGNSVAMHEMSRNLTLPQIEDLAVYIRSKLPEAKPAP